MSDVMTVMAKLDGDARGMVNAFSTASKASRKMADDAESSGTNAVGSFDKMGKGIGKVLGPLGGIMAAAFGVGAIVNFGKQAIDSASDLQEAGTAVGAVFGPATDSVNAWAASAATAFGQSTLQALDAAKTFGVYGSQAGLAAEANAQFSMTLTSTASDLASFHNADPSEVIAAIGSGLRGEAEPLRKFGILMNEDTLAAAALKAGISDGLQPLDAQQKILAANALILGSVGVASGDFARTSEGLANQQRILGANFTNLSATIGSAFVPILGTAASFINSSVFPALQGMATAMEGRVGPALDGMGGGFDKVMAVIGPVANLFGSTLGPVVSALGPQLITLATSLSPLGILLQALQPVLPVVAKLLGTIGTVLSGALAAVLPTVTELIATLVDVLSGALASVLPTIGVLVETLGGVLLMLMPTVSAVASILGDTLGVVLQAVAPLIGALLPVVNQLLVALMPIIEPVLGIVSALLPLVGVAGDLIGAILPPLVDLFMALLKPILALITPILGLLTPALQFVADVIGVVVDAISGAITWLVKMAGDTETTGKVVGAVFQALGSVTSSVFGAIGAVIRGAIDAAVGNFRTIMAVAGVVGDTFRAVFGAIGGFISNAFSSAVSVVRGSINGVIGMVNGAIRALNGLKVSIPAWVPVVGGQSFGVNLPTIPMLATGGTATRGGLAMVGEQGPEIIRMPTGATVIPLDRAAEQLGGGTNVTFENHYHQVAAMDAAQLSAWVAQQQAWQLEGLGATA